MNYHKIEENTEKKIQERISVARENTWDSKVSNILSIINSNLNR
jgi:hypothetical protein